MAVTFSWAIKIYDTDGNFICSLPAATDRVLSFALNGIDTLSFTLYLDDEDAVNIRSLTRIVKVWRTIVDTENSVNYTDPASTPCFAGFVTRVEKQGALNQMMVVCQSPFWRLQSKFHRNNWKLVIDYEGQDTELDVDSGLPRGWEGGNMDGEKWDVSALCFKLIDLVNHQLGPTHPTAAQTGIVKPLVGPPFWEKTLTIERGRNVRRGTFVWGEIDEMLQQNSGIAAPDLVPEYIHNEGSFELMYFKTALHRGTDMSGSVSFDFCTGLSNLTDFSETEEIAPARNFANYVWAVGNSDPETRRKEVVQYTGDLGIDAIGNYMYIRDSDSDDVRADGTLERQANYDLARLIDDPITYAATQAVMKPPYFGVDYSLGDLAMFNADKGALQVSNLRLRIYEMRVTLSANCVEEYTMTIATDFFSKVPLE